MKSEFMVVHDTKLTLRNITKTLNDCNKLLSEAKTSDDIEASLVLLDSTYLKKCFLNNNNSLNFLHEANRRVLYKPTETLTLFTESVIGETKECFRKTDLSNIINLLMANDICIAISLHQLPKTVPVVTGCQNDLGKQGEVTIPTNDTASSTIEEFPEYEACIKSILEFAALDDSYFTKDMEEGAVKDASTVTAMKKRQFDNFIDNNVNKLLDDYRESRKKETHEQICKRSMKLSKVLTHLIIAFPLWCLNPGLAILSVIVPVIINKNTDSYYRTQLATELKTEERILEEKIKDADSLGDKGKKDKIKMMRLKDKVVQERDQIERGWA